MPPARSKLDIVTAALLVTATLSAVILGLTTWWSLGFLVGLLVAGAALAVRFHRRLFRWPWPARQTSLVVVYVAVTSGLFFGEVDGVWYGFGFGFGFFGIAVVIAMYRGDSAERRREVPVAPAPRSRAVESLPEVEPPPEPVHSAGCIECSPLIRMRDQEGGTLWDAINDAAESCPCVREQLPVRPPFNRHTLPIRSPQGGIDRSLSDLPCPACKAEMRRPDGEDDQGGEGEELEDDVDDEADHDDDDGGESWRPDTGHWQD